MANMAMVLNKESETLKMVEAWDDTCLVLINECSFASHEVSEKIQERAGHLKPSRNWSFLLFGGMNIVYAGDLFSQLEPPCHDPTY
jgi:hypothetical protein